MQPLTGLTLMMAIQAVHAERKRLRAAVAEAREEDQGDLEEMEVDYFKAAGELKEAYVEVCRTSLNLPPYEELLEDDER